MAQLFCAYPSTQELKEISRFSLSRWQCFLGFIPLKRKNFHLAAGELTFYLKIRREAYFLLAIESHATALRIMAAPTLSARP